MSTPIAGALAVTPLYTTAADAIVSWDDPAQTWRGLASGGMAGYQAGAGLVINTGTSPPTIALSVPVAVANGGTGTTTVMTPGSVIFAGAGGAYSQDNASLFWDDATNRLGISTASPGARLSINAATGQALAIDGSYQTLPALATGSNGVFIAQINFSNANDIAFFNTAQNTGGAAQGFRFMQMTGVGAYRDLMYMRGDGNVGIGTASPASALDVNGIISLRGNAIVENTLSATVLYNPGGTLGIQLAAAENRFAGSTAHNFLDASNSTYWASFYSGGSSNQTGVWAVISAREMKQDLQPYTRGLEAITALNPVVFRYRAGTPFATEDEPSRPLMGLVADEVQPHVPEIVGQATMSIGKGEAAREATVDTLEPGNLIYAVINSIKQLAARIEALEARP